MHRRDMLVASKLSLVWRILNVEHCYVTWVHLLNDLALIRRYRSWIDIRRGQILASGGKWLYKRQIEGNSPSRGGLCSANC